MANSSALNRALRTLQQGVVAAAGTGAVATAVNGLESQVLALVQIFLTGLVSQIQNALEDSGKIPTYLKPSLDSALKDIDKAIDDGVKEALAALGQPAPAPEPAPGG